MSSRRILNATDESTYSIDSETKSDARIAATYLNATELSLLSGHAILSRSLSVKSIISTASSFARRSQQAFNNPDLQQLVQIGQGLQGAIFEQAGRSLIFKKENPGNSELPTNLRHEHKLHTSVLAAFQEFGVSVQCNVLVPRVYNIIGPESKVWDTDNQKFKFPEAYQSRTTLVEMERILPLPKVIRKALITHFYPQQKHEALSSNIVDEILNLTANKHCLARIYLGKRLGAFTKEKFSLRNFPLYLAPMENLELDIHSLADSMGSAFAIMHWGAGVNGDDVEFVFGTAAKSDPTSENFQKRRIGFYLLDFGQCDSVDLSDEVASVYQSFKGALVTGDNQLFIPHYKNSPALFASFKRGYIRAAEFILREKGLEGRFCAADFMLEYEEYAEDFL
ncbi:hypothetical protein MY4038_004541 [Beauveria bassiana]